MVVIAGKITVRLRGNPLVRESEGLGAQVWLHCMSNMLHLKTKAEQKMIVYS